MGAQTFRAIILVFLFTASALAVQPDEKLADPALEARAAALSRQLRCVVCQNQTIDDSASPLARDLRLLLRQRLEMGDSDEAAIAVITQRYGDFVLLQPRFNAQNMMLWLLPFFVLLAGAWMIWRKRTVEIPAKRE